MSPPPWDTWFDGVGLGSTAPTPERGGRPELEFIFRTLVDLRMDVDDLRTEFEVYRGTGSGMAQVKALQAGGELREVHSGDEIESGPWKLATDMPVETVSEVISVSEPGLEAPPAPEHQPGNLVLPPGLTMEEIEREAIVAVLDTFTELVGETTLSVDAQSEIAIHR